jgi:hypothetical protein
VAIEPSLNIRYRVEVVDQTLFTEQAVASTVRTPARFDDRSFTAETKYGEVQYILYFHRLTSGLGSTNFDNELDFLLSKRWEHHALSLKYACFQTSSFDTKPDKLWTWYEYSV